MAIGTDEASRGMARARLDSFIGRFDRPSAPMTLTENKNAPSAIVGAKE